MKINKILFSGIAASALLLSSCTDSFLDVLPDTRVELETVDQLRMILNDGYPYYNYATVCELSSDNVEDNDSPDDNGLRYNLTSYSKGDDEAFAWEEVKSATGSDTPSGIWEAYYHSIACANSVLEAINDMKAAGTDEDSTEISALRGEALILRAYCHFILANVFCDAYRGPELSKDIVGLPYAKTTEKTVKPHYERGNLADFYANIEADIDSGLPLINNGIYEIPKYHFNTSAANAFAANFYLFKRDYKKCLECCNAAFGGEEVSAASYMNTIWSHLGEFYYIKDFGLFTQNIDKQRNLLLLATYSQGWRRYIGGRRYAPIRNAKRATVQGPGPSWQKNRFKSSATGEVFAMNPCFNGCCGSNSKAEYGTYFAGNCCEQFEYTNKIAGIGYTHMTRSEYTGEDVVLMRAEAKLFLGDKEGCIADLRVWDESHWLSVGSYTYEQLTEELIRSFYHDSDPGYEIVKTIHLDEVCPSDEYHVTDEIEPMLQCIQHFRRIEGVHMGKRWFDIKRFGLEFTRKIGYNRVESLTMMDSRKAIQIPSEVIAAGLEANTRADVDSEDSNIERYEYVK